MSGVHRFSTVCFKRCNSAAGNYSIAPRLRLSLALSLLAASALVLRVEAQGTTFTYQGHLDDAGVSASGSYDVRFTVWNAAAGGAQLAGPTTYFNIPVVDGLFAVDLNFGSGVFSGAARWLEIGVQTNGGGGFVTLTPRTEFTSTPYAITALQAQSAASVPSGSIGSAEVANNSITSADLGPNSVGSSEVIDNSLTANDLAGNSVGASEIAANAVGQSEIATGGVASSEVLDNSLTANDLAANSVTASEIAASAVGTSEVANGSLTTADLNLTSVDARYVNVTGDTMTGDLTLSTAGNTGDITLENTFPFIVLDRQSSGGNAGLGFRDNGAYAGWLYLRGSDSAIAMSAGTSAVVQPDLVLTTNGTVGINTADAFTDLTVEGTIGFPNSTDPGMYIFESGTLNADKPLITHSPAFSNYGMWYEDSGDTFTFRASATDTTAIRVAASGGWMTINTDTRASGYELSVDGQIACEEVLVQDSGSWPDYVFEPDYHLRSLEEVEIHIKANKRLPGIPSAEIVAAEGLSIGQMQKRMMEKIEELTLYTIEQEKRIAELETRLGE